MPLYYEGRRLTDAQERVLHRARTATRDRPWHPVKKEDVRPARELMRMGLLNWGGVWPTRAADLALGINSEPQGGSVGKGEAI